MLFVKRTRNQHISTLFILVPIQPTILARSLVRWDKNERNTYTGLTGWLGS